MWTPELNYLPQVSLNIAPPLHISNVISQMTAMIGGAGIGVLPHFMARNEPNLTRILPNEIRLTRSYWLITHADTRDFARVRLTTKFLDDTLRSVGTEFWLD